MDAMLPWDTFYPAQTTKSLIKRKDRLFMDWKKQAVEDLKSHALRQKGLENIKRIVLANRAACKGIQPEGVAASPVWNDRQLDLVCEE